MRKSLTVLATAAVIASASVAAPTTADARRGWWAPAIIGGLAAGAIIGGALARPHGDYGYYGNPSYYAPGYGYAPGPDRYEYYAPAPTEHDYHVAPGPSQDCWGWRHGQRHRWC